jgi:transposase-like protein
MSLKPDKPRRKRSKEPKPFTGYIHKPLCEACEQGIDARPHAPGAPPPMMIFTRGRPRTIDTSGHFCPDHDCPYHGWLGRGNIRANGHPGGQPWRQLQCVSCEGFFYETHGTIFHRKRSSPGLIVHVIACLAEGLGIRGTARVFEIDANTVLKWLVEATEHLHAFSAYFLHDLHLNQVQLANSAKGRVLNRKPKLGGCYGRNSATPPSNRLIHSGDSSVTMIRRAKARGLLRGPGSCLAPLTQGR